MRAFVIAAVVSLCGALMGACGADQQELAAAKAKKKQATTVYFGWLLGTTEPAAVAIEVDRAGARGRSAVRAYVCDGRGEPEGMAIWFSGKVDAAATRARGKKARLVSAGKQEELTLDYVSKNRVQGSFKDATGARRQFVAYPAIDGAGIYEVTLDDELRYRGTSTNGDTLRAKADASGRTTGVIATAAGKRIRFTVRSLALATPADLEARGLPTDYGKYKDVNQVPGEYVAVIAPGGSHWLGRSGNVRGGSSGNNIIGLDKKC